jgi:histidinol phosphatase-like PHP family hydrolase
VNTRWLATSFAVATLVVSGCRSGTTTVTGTLEVGCLVSIDSDAHATGELDDVRWGVDQARRAWVEPNDVINARPRDELLAWVAAKPERVAA